MADLDEALARLSGILVDESTVDSVLQLVLALATAATTSDSASITILTGHGFETLKAADPEVVALDAIQYQTLRGPCVEAIRADWPVVTDLDRDRARWPEFAAAAREQNVTSVFSHPLRTREKTASGLNLYSHRPDSTETWNHDAVAAFARTASIAIANSAAFEQLSKRNDGLMTALKTREVIGEAKGILMHRDGLTSDEAFDELRTRSQHTNRKLRDVAKDVRDESDDERSTDEP